MSSNVGASGGSCTTPSQHTFPTRKYIVKRARLQSQNGPDLETPAIQPCRPQWRRAEPHKISENHDQRFLVRLEEACGPPVRDVVERDHGQLASLHPLNVGPNSAWK